MHGCTTTATGTYKGRTRCRMGTRWTPARNRRGRRASPCVAPIAGYITSAQHPNISPGEIAFLGTNGHAARFCFWKYRHALEPTVMVQAPDRQGSKPFNGKNMPLSCCERKAALTRWGCTRKPSVSGADNNVLDTTRSQWRATNTMRSFSAN